MLGLSLTFGFVINKAYRNHFFHPFFEGKKTGETFFIFLIFGYSQLTFKYGVFIWMSCSVVLDTGMTQNCLFIDPKTVLMSDFAACGKICRDRKVLTSVQN